MAKKLRYFMTKYRLIPLLTLAISSLILSACAQVIPNCGAVTSPPVHQLAGTQWDLIRWHYTSSNDGKTRLRAIPHGEIGKKISLTISLDGKIASGNTGCNLYTAQVIADERGILLEQISSSKKVCEPNLADLEYKFLGYLSSYRTLIRDGDRMLLMTRDGEVLSFALRIQ